MPRHRRQAQAPAPKLWESPSQSPSSSQWRPAGKIRVTVRKEKCGGCPAVTHVRERKACDGVRVLQNFALLQEDLSAGKIVIPPPLVGDEGERDLSRCTPQPTPFPKHSCTRAKSIAWHLLVLRGNSRCRKQLRERQQHISRAQNAATAAFAPCGTEWSHKGHNRSSQRPGRGASTTPFGAFPSWRRGVGCGFRRDPGVSAHLGPEGGNALGCIDLEVFDLLFACAAAVGGRRNDDEGMV